jgi:hypothetical protein
VYLQDTFMTPPLDAELGVSHVLALTASETGVRQLGPYYGVVPYKTRAWTMGQVGLVYGLRATGPDALGEIIRRMRMTNATHLVVADPGLGARIEQARELRLSTRIGRFSVFEAVGGASGWVVPVRGDATVTVTKYAAGAVDFSVTQNPRGITALVKVSYHPFWRLRGPEGARISEGSSGLVEIEGLPSGDYDVSLVYRQPRWPFWISLGGWFLVLGIAVVPLHRKT